MPPMLYASAMTKAAIYRAMLHCAFVLCVACGAAAPAEQVQIAPPMASEPETQAPAPAESIVEPEAHDLLMGRFRITLPASAEPANIWPSERSSQRDSWRMHYENCDLVLATSSDGLVRPAELSLNEGETRTWVPASAESDDSRLEVISVGRRTFEVLHMSQASVGAVVFEPDGSATDFFVWPEAPDLEGESVAEEARADDACWAVAERLLGDVLGSLRPQLAFDPQPAHVLFGWDTHEEAQARYVGSLPDGWVITTREASDASFARVHRRQEWSASPSDPSPRAEFWMFSGEDDRPIRGRRTTVFGYPLRFDPEGCARVVEPDMPFQQYLCLHGSRREQRELLNVLQRFLREAP